MVNASWVRLSSFWLRWMVIPSQITPMAMAVRQICTFAPCRIGQALVAIAGCLFVIWVEAKGPPGFEVQTPAEAGKPQGRRGNIGPPIGSKR